MRFDDYIQATNAAKTPDALFEVIERVVAEEGYTQLAYTCLTGPIPTPITAPLNPPSTAVVLLKYPEPWIAHYLQNDCHRVDPVIRYSPTLSAPYTWDWLLHQPHVNREAKIFMMEAEEAGLKDGVSIPMIGPTDNAFVLSVAREDYGDDPATLLRFLHGVALQFHFAYCSMAEFGQGSADVVLTERAERCLTLLAAGLTETEISDRLKISEPRVRHHLKTAAHALGTRTLAQTVYEAIRADIVPLEKIGPVRRKN